VRGASSPGVRTACPVQESECLPFQEVLSPTAPWLTPSSVSTVTETTSSFSLPFPVTEVSRLFRVDGTQFFHVSEGMSAASTPSEALSTSATSIGLPPKQPSAMLVMSGGEGYIDFRIGEYFLGKIFMHKKGNISSLMLKTIGFLGILSIKLKFGWQLI
jgi:hypothetical protein